MMLTAQNAGVRSRERKSQPRLVANAASADQQTRDQQTRLMMVSSYILAWNNAVETDGGCAIKLDWCGVTKSQNIRSSRECETHTPSNRLCLFVCPGQWNYSSI